MKKYLLAPLAMFSFLFIYSQDNSAYPCYKNKFEGDTAQHVFTRINTQASYKGYTLKWKAFLEKNVSFKNIITTLPDSVQYFEDTVSLKFIVSKNGMLSNLEIVYGLDEEAIKEAIRLIKASCPNWIPGIDSGGVYRNSWHTESFYFMVDRRTNDLKTRIGIKL